MTWPCKPVETICKRAILLFLALVLVLSAAPVVAAEGQLFDDVKTMQSIAEDLTSFLRLEISGHVNMRNQVLDAALDHVEQIYPYEWICDAVEEAVTNNVRNWRYIESILRSWKENGKHGTYQQYN